MSTETKRWFEQPKEFGAKSKAVSDEEVPELWTKCPECQAALYNETLEQNQQVCPECDHHFRIDGPTRLALLCDPQSIKIHGSELTSTDPLGFVDSKSYSSRLDASMKKTERNDAFIAASAEIEGLPVEVGVFDFRFMGGSMGSVVGELVTRVFERANKNGCPAIVVSASGGARMQEGVLSLMQMAKSCGALAKLRDEANMPYISVLTHPTTGGVAASFAMLGDIIVAEPKSLIGFAGPRVIEQTIGEALPEGFQTAEYLLDHGMVDTIVSRLNMKRTLAVFLRQLLRLPPQEIKQVEQLADSSPEGTVVD
jgi:acetyl-CoA carboxylase carboxyl transferase subunit beta